MEQLSVRTDTIRALLIEDNPADAAAIEADLEHIKTAKFDLEAVATLGEGLGRLKAEHFDVLLLDLGLPDSQGERTIWRVTAAMSCLPIVVLTASDDEALAMEAISQGVQDYFVKGAVDERLLARAIRYAIHRKRIEAELRSLNATLEQRVRERTAELEQAVAALGEEVSEHRRSLQILYDHLGTSVHPTTPKDQTPKPG